MNKLVIQSRRKLEIGKVYTGMHDPWFNILPNQTFLVVAESTDEEWIKCIMEFGESRDWAEMYAALDPYFYEIKTD